MALTWQFGHPCCQSASVWILAKALSRWLSPASCSCSGLCTTMSWTDFFGSLNANQFPMILLIDIESCLHDLTSWPVQDRRVRPASPFGLYSLRLPYRIACDLLVRSRLLHILIKVLHLWLVTISSFSRYFAIRHLCEPLSYDILYLRASLYPSIHISGSFLG